MGFPLSVGSGSLQGLLSLEITQRPSVTPNTKINKTKAKGINKALFWHEYLINNLII
jgi:hypothetical protein